MFQRIRDWWTLQSKSPHSPEYDAAMERQMRGFREIQRRQAADAEERRRREAAWWQSAVARQEAGRIEEVVREMEADAGLGEFVVDPMERRATLYAREVDRLLARGDRAGAEAAASEAVRLMSIWASWSTSGGEGTARMSEMARMDEALKQRLALTPPPLPQSFKPPAG